MPPDPADHEVAAGRVEMRRRLVEDPETRAAELQTAEAEPPPLAGGKVACMHVEPRVEPKLRGDRRHAPVAVTAAAAELEVLARRELTLQAVRVPPVRDLAAPLGRQAPHVGAAPQHGAGRRQREAREHAQQRRLARAVRADDERDLTRADREIEPFEQAMLAAPDCERARVEPGCLGHERPASAQRKCRWYSDLRGKSKVVYSTRNRRGRQLVANNKGF